MLIDRNEMIAPRDVSARYGTYKKNSELEDFLTARPGSNSPGIAGGYAATGTFQHPFRWKIANIPQGPLLIDVETGVGKKTFAQDLGVMKNFKEMIESFNSSDNGKKTFAQDSKLLDKLKEAMESFNSSGNEKKLITGDSELLKKLKEIMEELNLSANEKKISTEDSVLLKELKELIERINSLEQPFADIREPKEKFSTPPQFDLSADLQEFLEKQEADEEQSTIQSTGEEPAGNTNNTADNGDAADYNLLNIEA